MPDAENTKFVCIHGHFYQPPRENPWLNEIEREPSAAPHHDWNERIHEECYRANTAARFVDSENHVLDMSNNYKFLSFNFGPTLMRWIERRDRAVHDTIIEADAESCMRFDGHGNGVAQVYNHIIMPLASRRDKTTQVRWGIRDFEMRFGRRPEGMWLAETAVDAETLDVLAGEGIRFTILSPFQAARWRFAAPGDGQWRDARGGTIPTGRAYRYQCRGARHIDIFFYDQSIAHGIAFEKLLGHSERMLRRIDERFAGRPRDTKEPWLVNAATDGESYGHHFQFGDMALAAVFRELEREKGARVLNYSAFLASFPVIAEVEILENSAWSCSHGLGRWQEDCGCNTGAPPGWRQRWRGPLREALNHLRDALALHYEKEMGSLARDPWDVRNEYVEVLHQTARKRLDFALRSARRPLKPTEAQTFLQLLEMQACSLAMFTSCGWFFNDISQLEAVLILRYAARAIQLAKRTGAVSPAPEFLKILGEAPGNTPEYPDGASVYRKKVQPGVVDPDRVVANYVIRNQVIRPQPVNKLYCFRLFPVREHDLGSSPIPCHLGRIAIRDERSSGEEEYLYALLHFGGLDFRCSVKPFVEDSEYESILESLQKSIEEQNTVEMVRTLDRSFGASFFSLRDVMPDMRSVVALEISRAPMKLYEDFQRHFYLASKPLMQAMRGWDIPLPADLDAVAKRVFGEELSRLIREMLEHEPQSPRREPLGETADFFQRAHMGRLRSLLKEAANSKVTVGDTEATQLLGDPMVSLLEEIGRDPTPQRAGRLLRMVEICRALGIRPKVWEMQTQYFALIGKGLTDPNAGAALRRDLSPFLTRMDAFLQCRFVELLSKPTGHGRSGEPGIAGEALAPDAPGKQAMPEKPDGGPDQRGR